MSPRSVPFSGPRAVSALGLSMLLSFAVACRSDGDAVATTSAPDASERARGESVAAPPAAPALVAFTQTVPGTEITFEMLPIPAGEFVMGSPAQEKGRGDDEGPTRRVAISAFWMGRTEVTWDEYEQWMFSLERQRRDTEPTPADQLADAVTRPTPPYTDMTFGMGRSGYPAICMTQLAAATYCEWLSAKTGREYRLPTEAEWEYACRAGTNTAYSFGDDPAELDAYAWFGDNSDYAYHEVGKKEPNPFGLCDMHGNVAEWVLDQYAPYVASADGAVLVDPLVPATKTYPHAARGGSWEDPAPALRSAARRGSEPDWKMQDPQIPQSVWYFTDAQFVGFRVVCEP